ncbi:hypothetical protein [Dactylosporangium sp. CA-092794]|uniref:hypothetical protein n=1 Tax=Dactylosporangium sp. CA-092794 TaxID=3239929 RepID=UPI003D90B33B
MRLVTYRHEHAFRVGAVLGLDTTDPAVHDVLLDGRPWLGGPRELIAASGGQPARIGVGPAGVALAGIEVAPAVPNPSKIVAAPVNYVDHQAEMNESSHIAGLGVFLKAPTAGWCGCLTTTGASTRRASWRSSSAGRPGT